ncbi:MAG: hypothetical protein ACXAB7_08170 [Candidatus Kariarchaeaceae archaeon]
MTVLKCPTLLETMMVKGVKVELSVKYELAGLIHNVMEHTGLTVEEIIHRALFHYYPEIFLQSDIEEVVTWLFLDNSEQFVLSKIKEWYKISEESVFNQIFGLQKEEKTI